MARPRPHLNRAPIREAVIDIKIEPRAEFASVVAAVTDIATGFSKRTDMWEATFGFQFEPGIAPMNSGESSKIGVRLDSTAPPHVLQCRVNGLSLSRLTPYEDWQQVRNAAKQYWSLFAQALGPCKVTRLAVRYINALRLPLPISDFSDFLTAAPQVPQELPQSVSGFLQRVVIESPTPYSAVVTQALENFAPGIEFIVVLDIDVFRTVELKPDADEIWTILDGLRTAKNDIFFSHLTEKAVDQFT